MHLYRAERAGGGRTAGAAAAESPTAGVHPYPLRGISSYGIYFPYAGGQVVRDLFLVCRRQQMDIATRGTSCSIRERPHSRHSVRSPPWGDREAA